MTEFIIKKLPYGLTSNACLALVGQYAKRLSINALVDRKFPVAVGGIPYGQNIHLSQFPDQNHRIDSQRR